MASPTAATRPTPRPGILDLEMYVPGESGLPSGVKPLKLSSNESPLGASPKAKAALAATAGDIERYPDGGSTALRRAIGAVYGLNPDRIVCGAGSDEILQLISHAYLAPGDEAIHSQYGFMVYKLATLANGATPVIAPEKGFKTDVDAILSCVTPRTKLIYLANPNNPTGTYIPFEEVRRLHAGLPNNVILLLDAAYCEYVRRNDYEAGVELVGASENVMMTRTFSKIHGLASLRIGWMYGPAAIVDAMNRLRGPFNVSSVAQAAAIAAIQDKAFVDAAIAHNERWLPWLSAEIEKTGLTVTPSVGNFILVHFKPGDEKRTAKTADAFMKGRGIILRAMGGYGMPNALRITIGTESDNRAVAQAFAAFMA